MPLAAPRSSLTERRGRIRMVPSVENMTRSWPGSMCNSSRMDLGMTIWNLGETRTRALSMAGNLRLPIDSQIVLHEYHRWQTVSLESVREANLLSCNILETCDRGF